MNKLIIQGIKREEFSPEEIQSAKQNNFEIKTSIIFNNSRNISHEHKLDIGKNELLEFVFEDNTTWVGNTDVLHDLFPVAAKEKSRSGDEFLVPMYLESSDSERGLIGSVALKLLNVFAKKAVGAKVIDIAAGLEKKLLENQSGVFALDEGFHLKKNKITETKNPNLLFIHGTNSSTWGSFAEIRNTELWKHMLGVYGSNIFGLQHETMTLSPIQNVINLFKELPGECTLHVITHSRGGLVGDVLARFSNGNKGFTDKEIAYLEKTNRKTDVAGIKELQKLAAGKNIIIEKFIRVACPAYGTTILSKRLDHFLNISFNLIGLLGGVTSIIAGEFKSLISAAVDTKNDPGQLPGLEAMNPDSPFLKILNNPDNSINGSLTVISGNCGVRLNLKALLIIASKLFYMRDNDLVVDTRSMYCGSKRNIPIQYFFDEGPDVDHVHYFKNKNTQDALLAALKVADKIPGFTNLRQTEEELSQRNALLGLDGGEVFSDKVSGSKPIVIVLPGIMGSNLEAGNKKIWINYIRFLAGELTRLDISKQNIQAVSLIKTSYKKLVDHLKGEYDVVTFPFDWRQPLADAAAQLNSSIEKYLKLKVPIKIVGHSMGGVVTRDFIINHPATWKKLNESKDFKLLFLGAPLGGSYRIPYVLAGKDSIINQLSKIDLAHTKKELLDMFRKFPGLLGLLPIARQPNDFASSNTWQDMKKASVFDWSIPDVKDLQFFGAYRDKVLKQMDNIDMNNIIYIAGKDDATVCGFEIDVNLPGDEKIVFKSTVEGDQSVTWETGIPKNINTNDGLYFVEVSHGALANQPDIFNGISDILRSGKTELLSKNKPLSRSVIKEFNTVEEEVYDIDEASIENTLLGLRSKPPVEKKGKMPIKVSVSNGDLLYSSYPVLVGHFLTDGITSAEAIIDYYTGNTLREWHRLNLYPGEIGSSEVFINSKSDFKGTVVIGLGAPGRLSAFQLSRSAEQGAIKYMLELAKIKKNNSNRDLKADTGISVLLIGCGYGGLSIDSSIRAILQGVQNANNKIETLNRDGLNTIEHVEFVELYEDRCLQSLLVLSRIEEEKDRNMDIRLARKQLKKLLGSRTRIPMDNISDWWSRISIVLHKEENKELALTETALRFSSSTGSAREEQRDLQSSPQIVNKLIEEMSTKNMWNEGLAKTVFELMIPNDFKEDIKKQSNTMWVLDTNAAAYPWELLQDDSDTAPLCCTSGMIRQLQTDKYSLKINAASGNKVLVIGDPDLNGYKSAPQLPGAFNEANMVASLFDQCGYDMPNNCFRKSASQIVQAVFKDEYRIMHLAGHGVFNAKNPDQSGMLIGNNVFLSTREICQMSKVPDLVFVNCCYLGQMNAQSEETYSSRYKLAANIGTQLIMNGVKVVIAAGWAVNDTAALCFAKTFYEQMLGGVEFGKAIQKARSDTYDMITASGNKNNTWGAYQCYGDPFFKLTNIPRPLRSGSAGKGNKQAYFIAQEAEIALGNLINKTDTKSYSVKMIEEELNTIMEAIDEAKIRNASIIEKEATVFAECNNYEKAIEKFEALLGMEQAAFTIKALEKYCNIRAKLYVKNWKEGKKPKEQLTGIDKVIEDLHRLNKMSPTAERYSLIGSAYKRKSSILPAKKGKTNNDKTNALLKAADFYRMADAMPQNMNRAYALSNWLEIESILVRAGINAWAPDQANKSKRPSLKYAKQRIKEIIKTGLSSEADMDFWIEISIANAKLCMWLLEGKNTAELNEKDLTDTYLKVWGMAGSQNKKIAEIEHFDFLIDAYSGLEKSEKLVKTIKKIRSDLMNYLK